VRIDSGPGKLATGPEAGALKLRADGVSGWLESACEELAKKIEVGRRPAVMKTGREVRLGSSDPGNGLKMRPPDRRDSTGCWSRNAAQPTGAASSGLCATRVRDRAHFGLGGIAVEVVSLGTAVPPAERGWPPIDRQHAVRRMLGRLPRYGRLDLNPS